MNKNLRLCACCTVLFVAISVGLLIAVIVLAVQLEQLKDQQPQPRATNDWRKTPATPSVFDTLTESEITEIRDFLHSRPELNLVPVNRADMGSNYIYMMEPVLPKKTDVLRHLDSGGAMPARSARVSCFMGGENPPVIKEFIVSPVPNVAQYKDSDNPAERRPIPWHTRPSNPVELSAIDTALLKPVTKELFPILKETYGYWYHNCTDRCLVFNFVPRGIRDGDRHMLIWGFRSKIDGYYLWPVSLLLLVDVNGNDPTHYKLTRLYYENRAYGSTEELLAAYSTLPKHTYPFPTAGATYGSPDLRGERKANWKKLPKQTEPDGRRYTVDGQKVKYLDWEFNFRLRAVTGIQVMDIRFRGERLAYEISMADVAVYYSGNEPSGLLASFVDAGWSLGTLHQPLIKGYDCPENAAYFNNTFFESGTGKPRTYVDALCLFEQNTGLPVRRHRSIDFYNPDQSKYFYKFSMPGSVLILRGIPTVWNYDYIFDFVFHPNGVIEVKVASTGYIQTFTYPLGGNSPYGNFVNRDFGILANLHHHLFNVKVDFDIGGQQNRFETWDLQLENRTNPLAPEERWLQKRTAVNLRKTESEALIKYKFEEPKYYVMYNQQRNNTAGYARSYRIYANGFSKVMLPEGWYSENGIPWARHQVTVTKYKDNEDTTASIYNQADPYNPVKNFEKFYGDNEGIVDQDLVAWVSLGLQHIPVMEDIPVTTTPGKQLSVVLAPLNYFDEDPSMTSQDAIVDRP
ncbi:putative amine oxidase [copper-containing] [Lingula anatina]|uniref:Amine oxidase n=1 Tax=Lingula anatina TaxID=7574 RepID=A0A1S3IGS7_LINAN|nr:putative amine oxidase [copper-containing] [Lingula anatina]|eukprot:XP_013397343.1 putative amine oxidase [copper-containing] [Lingula anatina]